MAGVDKSVLAELLADMAPLPARTPAPCGTNAAARRHWAKKEKLDQACIEAAREYRNSRRVPAPLQPCGTEAAAHRHRRAGEPLDEACAEAQRAAWRRRGATRRAIAAAARAGGAR